MKRVLTGPFEFTPYRPWSAERRAAHSRILADRAAYPFWIGERGRRAEKLWINGFSFTQIADALGTTKGAISGYLRRKGLDRSSRISRPPKLAWTAPTVIEIWHTPQFIQIESISGSGWSIIKFHEDIPRGSRVMVSGEDYHEIVVQLTDDPDDIFPFVTKGGRSYRWDLFDWWCPIQDRL